jgi:hypothetical protein
MKVQKKAKNRDRTRRKERPSLVVQVIPAPTIFWHPSVSLEKLVRDFTEYRDSIIVD